MSLPSWRRLPSSESASVHYDRLTLISVNGETLTQVLALGSLLPLHLEFVRADQAGGAIITAVSQVGRENRIGRR